jgi:hypothetical protein
VGVDAALALLEGTQKSKVRVENSGAKMENAEAKEENAGKWIKLPCGKCFAILESCAPKICI